MTEHIGALAAGITNRIAEQTGRVKQFPNGSEDMNAIATVNAGLVPANMTEAMKLAEMMAGAKLVPAALQKSPADCLMVIQQAVRWQMDPFAVAQECSVIQGKLMHSGKLVAAVVNARGNLAERLRFSYSGEDQERTITISGLLRGEDKLREVAVRLGDVKTNNRVWQSQPDQQLMYHGCRVWARRHTPELMLGVWSPEEFDEAANGNTAEPIDIENEPVKPVKRTREQISAEADRKRRDLKFVTDDILQLDSLAQLERYERQELTPEFMSSLGMKQYSVEQTLETRRIELMQAEDAEAPSKADYIRGCHEEIDAFESADDLLVWWNSDAEKQARRNYALSKEEVQELMARVFERRASLSATEASLEHLTGDPTSTTGQPDQRAGDAPMPSESDMDASEAWRAELLELLANAKTLRAIDTIVATRVEPESKTYFPGDVGDIERAIERARKRVSKGQ